jgi:hypothetical protein
LESGQLAGRPGFVNAFRRYLHGFARAILFRLPAFGLRRKRYIMLRSVTMAIIAFAALSACAAPQGEFPSLLRRPYESNAPVLPPFTGGEPAPTALPSALSDQAASLTSRHRSAMNSYRQLLPAAAAAARGAAGTAAGNEAWVAAHLQVSRLDMARADSKAALAELDRLITAQFDADANRANAGFAALLTEYQTPIAADTAEQDAEIDRLSRIIGM